jgi:hypothetical protein
MNGAALHLPISYGKAMTPVNRKDRVAGRDAQATAKPELTLPFIAAILSHGSLARI